MRRVQEPYFARFGLTPSQWGVLRTLHRAAGQGRGDLRLTDLGDRLLVRPPSVTGVIDRLERMGYVTRTASESDLRAKYLSLTPAGRILVERVLEGHAARIRMLLGGLGPDERRQLHRLLDQLSSHLQTLVDGVGPPAASRPADRETGERNPS